MNRQRRARAGATPLHHDDAHGADSVAVAWTGEQPSKVAVICGKAENMTVHRRNRSHFWRRDAARAGYGRDDESGSRRRQEACGQERPPQHS
jgi:hypothetical protein